jgi:putative membrane protein
MSDMPSEAFVIDVIETPAVEADVGPPPSVLQTDDARPIAAAAVQAPPVSRGHADEARPVRRGISPTAVAGIGIAVLVVGLLGIDAVDTIFSRFERGFWLGAATLAVVAAGIAGSAWLVFFEITALVKIRSVEAIQAHIAALTGNDPQRAVVSELRRALDALPRTAAVKIAIAGFEAHLRPHHNAAQAIEIASRMALAPCDRLAEGAARRAAAAAFAATAISPTALTDSALFIARAIRLVREIAESYGHRPRLAATIHLVRRIAVNAGTIGAVDLVGDALAQHLGGALLERLSSEAGESLFAAQRMVRIGILAMTLCRPLPFPAGETPSMSSLLKGLVRRTAP